MASGRCCPPGQRRSGIIDKKIAEAALSHSQGGVRATYQTGTYLKKRRMLMDDLDAFCSGRPLQDNVVELKRGAYSHPSLLRLLPMAVWQSGDMLFHAGKFDQGEASILLALNIPALSRRCAVARL